MEWILWEQHGISLQSLLSSYRRDKSPISPDLYIFEDPIEYINEVGVYAILPLPLRMKQIANQTQHVPTLKVLCGNEFPTRFHLF
jgi:hypothetical protein